jgi:hypothetical protein
MHLVIPIFLHPSPHTLRGLSEVHTNECMFIGHPTICQKLALWKWRRKREEELLSAFGNIAGLHLQRGGCLIGDWPSVPESWTLAGLRSEHEIRHPTCDSLL